MLKRACLLQPWILFIAMPSASSLLCSILR
ncbi:hypothetical protein CJF30_00009295 [Rutstroemia sp. NJR-2017a BBW]|nr:hypothetical protein CJF30_00009295 [Rutstroemia sp. NJR-2017a BBW]